MVLTIDEVKSNALAELEPMVAPAREFMKFVKDSLVSGVDTISTSQLANWLFSIPTLYGELRCIEVDCLLTADLLDAEIDRVKSDVMGKNQGLKVTDARNLAAQAVNDLQVRQYVAKYMSKYVNAIHSQLEMLIFSVRNVYESRTQKVDNDV